MKLIQRAAALALATVMGAAVLTGCGGTPSSSSKPTSTSGKPTSSASTGSSSTAKEEEKPVAAHTISYNDSKTKKYFISVTKSQNYYIDEQTNDTGRRTACAKKGEKYYGKVTGKDDSGAEMRVCFFYDGEKLYFTELVTSGDGLTEADKIAVYISDEEKIQSWATLRIFSTNDEMKKLEPYYAKATITAESKATSEGFRYIETLKGTNAAGKEFTIVHYFKGNDLVKIVWNVEGETEDVTNVYAWTTNVPDSLFKVPEGYTVMSEEELEEYLANRNN